MYMTIFYIIIFSIIAHKEKRFMLPIVAFVFLVLGYLLVRKTRVWGKKVIKTIIWLSIVGEIGIHLAYYIHHNLWVMTDYMLIKNQSLDSHPHSLYTMKRFDQPWHSLLHSPDEKKRSKVYIGRHDPDFFRKKYYSNLILALDRESELCIEMLQQIEDNIIRPEYVMMEEVQQARSLYSFQACQDGLLKMGKNSSMPEMYHKEYSHRTQYGFNFTSFMLYMKPTLLYRLNMKN